VNLSPPGRLLLHPFRGYAELARASGEDAPTITGGALRFLFVIGSVVALTAAGRLAPVELVVAMGSFAYVPIAQLVALATALRLVTRTTPLRRAFALYLAGHGPWLVTLVVIAAICLVVPAPAHALFVLLPTLVVFTFAWSGVLTYACFRRGLDLSGARSGIATAIYVLVLTAIVVGYFLGMGQLGPLWR
jgi:hypothetical protein